MAERPPGMQFTEFTAVKESWRVLVKTELSMRVPPDYLTQHLANQFLSQQAKFGIIAVTHNESRPWNLYLDFQSEGHLDQFFDAFDDKIIQLDEKVIMKLHFVEVHGATEKDWFKAFYGESKTRLEQAFRISEPGSRPDTVWLRNVPGEWFGIKHHPSRESYAGRSAPLRRAMVKFGGISRLHVETRRRAGSPFMYPKPVSRKRGASTKAPKAGPEKDEDDTTTDEDTPSTIEKYVVFDAWVQYATYEGFKNAMFALANCCLLLTKRPKFGEELDDSSEDEDWEHPDGAPESEPDDESGSEAESKTSFERRAEFRRTHILIPGVGPVKLPLGSAFEVTFDDRRFFSKENRNKRDRDARLRTIRKNEKKEVMRTAVKKLWLREREAKNKVWEALKDLQEQYSFLYGRVIPGWNAPVPKKVGKELAQQKKHVSAIKKTLRQGKLNYHAALRACMAFGITHDCKPRGMRAKPQPPEEGKRPLALDLIPPPTPTCFDDRRKLLHIIGCATATLTKGTKLVDEAEISRMQTLPSVYEALNNVLGAKRFLQVLVNQSPPISLAGKTIFVPVDDAFLDPDKPFHHSDVTRMPVAVDHDGYEVGYGFGAEAVPFVLEVSTTKPDQDGNIPLTADLTRSKTVALHPTLVPKDSLVTSRPPSRVTTSRPTSRLSSRGASRGEDKLADTGTLSLPSVASPLAETTRSEVTGLPQTHFQLAGQRVNIPPEFFERLLQSRQTNKRLFGGNTTMLLGHLKASHDQKLAEAQSIQDAEDEMEQFAQQGTVPALRSMLSTYASITSARSMPGRVGPSLPPIGRDELAAVAAKRPSSAKMTAPVPGEAKEASGGSSEDGFQSDDVSFPDTGRASEDSEGVEGSDTLAPLSRWTTQSMPRAGGGAGYSRGSGGIWDSGPVEESPRPFFDTSGARRPRVDSDMPQPHTRIMARLAHTRAALSHYETMLDSTKIKFEDWHRKRFDCDVGDWNVEVSHRVVLNERERARAAGFPILPWGAIGPKENGEEWTGGVEDDPDALEKPLATAAPAAKERPPKPPSKSSSRAPSAASKRDPDAITHPVPFNPKQVVRAHPGLEPSVWEWNCMGVHVMNGPYTIQDLEQAPGSRMPCSEPTHAVRVGLSGDGSYFVMAEPVVDHTGTSLRNTSSRKVHGTLVVDEPDPVSRSRVVRANVWCQGGTVLHLVEKIMFPDEFNLKHPC